MTVLQRTVFQARAATSTLAFTSKSVPLTTACDEPPIHVRPFSSDVPVVVSLHGEGEYDRVSSLPNVKTIVDLGANIGASVRLWQRWYPTAQIVAVEPDPDSYALAARNCTDSMKAGDELIQAAVSDRGGKVYLERDDEPWTARTHACSGPGMLEVDAVDMPTLISRCRHSTVDLLKCDIEGGEAVVFSQCSEWIKSVRSLLVEVHPPYTDEKLLSDLRRNGSRLQPIWREPVTSDMAVWFLRDEGLSDV